MRVIGSSAPNGSSISSTGGSAASARARPTRWRWPPESCAGIALARRPARGRRARAARRCGRGVRSLSASRAGAARCRCSRRSSCAGRGRSAGSRSRCRAAARRAGSRAIAAAVDADLAGVEGDQPVHHLQRRRLAAARRADEHAERRRPGSRARGRRARRRRGPRSASSRGRRRSRPRSSVLIAWFLMPCERRRRRRPRRAPR